MSRRLSNNNFATPILSAAFSVWTAFADEIKEKEGAHIGTERGKQIEVGKICTAEGGLVGVNLIHAFPKGMS